MHADNSVRRDPLVSDVPQAKMIRRHGSEDTVDWLTVVNQR